MSVVELLHSTKHISKVESEKNRVWYLNSFSEVVQMARMHFGGEGWWIVGGMAREAWAGNGKFSTTTNKGQLRDVDFLLRRDKVQNFDEMRRENGTGLHLGAPFQWYLRINEDSSQLVYGNIRLDVPRYIFDTKSVNLNGVEFPTVTPQTLFHLYSIHGKLDRKYHDARQVARLMLQYQEFPREDYAAFKEYHKIKNPLNNVTGWLMDFAVNTYFKLGFNHVLSITGPNSMKLIRTVWEKYGNPEVS